MTVWPRLAKPRTLGVVALSAVLAGCTPGSGDASGPDTASTGATTPATGPVPLRVPDRTTIPEGPMGEAILRGEQLAMRTREELPNNVGNGLHCTSCHLNGGTVAGAAPWVGLAAVFPEFRARNAQVNLLETRVNDCFERSMDGTPLDPTSPEMAAIVAYITWLSRDVPIGREVEGRGFRRIEPAPTPNRDAGAALYAARCAACHGPDGAGQTLPDGGYLFPALWGPESYNIGAGMARLNTAAAYVRWNMPLGQGGTLTDQEAYDVADFFIHQDRPPFARAAEDWPSGGKPNDARY